LAISVGFVRFWGRARLGRTNVGSGEFFRFGIRQQEAADPSRVVLAEMDAVVPWPELLAVVEPHYPRTGGRGRPPVGLAAMLRIYFLQQWFALSDRRMEDGLYDIESLRRFAGFSFQTLADGTSIQIGPPSGGQSKGMAGTHAQAWFCAPKLSAIRAVRATLLGERGCKPSISDGADSFAL